jgi:hypothetical protein
MSATLDPLADAPAPAAETLELERALAVGLGLARAAEALAFQLDLPALDPIDLPPVIGSDVDQARLRTVPPLYLAAELEDAQLLPAAEALAGVFVSGGVDVNVGAAAERVLAFWRGRHERFSREERRAFFSRLFGGAGPQLAGHGTVNAAFEGMLLEVAQALAELQPQPGYPPLPAAEMTLRAAASDLASNLATRTNGIPQPTATSILQAISDALAIFKEPALQSALGANSPWAAVRGAAQRYLRVDPWITAHVRRGKAGMLILSWLAEAVPTFDTSRALAEPDAATIAASVDWIQASLALRQREAAPAA